MIATSVCVLFPNILYRTFKCVCGISFVQDQIYERVCAQISVRMVNRMVPLSLLVFCLICSASSDTLRFEAARGMQ
eukprot:gene21598-8305_t